jgi:phage terminase large subunit
MFISFNPSDATHWTVSDFIEKPHRDTSVMHSTWRDNPFLPKHYIQDLQDLKNQNYDQYQIFNLGHPAMLENIIYSKWDILSKHRWPKDIQNTLPHGYGGDYGYSNPSAVIAGWKWNGEYYIDELVYQSYMTVSDTVKKLGEVSVSKQVPFYPDWARTDWVEELRRAGYCVMEVDKSPGSVKDGIDYIKGRMLHITPESLNVIKEIRNYSYKKDRNGNVQEVPAKSFDHAMDGMRYWIHSTREDSFLGDHHLKPGMFSVNPMFRDDLPSPWSESFIPTMDRW